ncbi:phage major capsid protein [Nonomuraea turkmeniaca]|uniref:Phage major capsid protein n=1 Tax=Nonomuraea turkmeniaca TaxID=103838 RepID=A0A5S4F6E6_9ACTN|nr:phage major capsid protein [Nonomuraea turkmeniaca]TMR11743.1 phage major capsid protein [Nonomuraea turkmeniaca]
MSDRLKRLIDERAQTWQRMLDIRAAAEGENRDLTGEERTNWDAAEARLNQLAGDIEREENFAKLDKIDRSQIVVAGSGGEVEEREATDPEKRYQDAFDAYLRHGMSGLRDEQRNMLMSRQSEIRAQSAGTNSAGGYTVPPGFLVRITETMKAFGGIMNIAEVITTDTGQPLQWPTFDGTSQVGQILAENTAETALDMTFGTKTLGAFTYSSRFVQVSLQLLQDTAFDLDSWVPRQLGIRIGRAVSTHLATGTGTGQPEGLFTNATAGKTGTTGQTTSVIYDDLVDLIHSVDPAYRAGARFVMNDSSLKVIRKLKDADNRPLWEPSLQIGVPDTLLGYPITVDQGVAVMAANAKSIGFGDVSQAYIVRQVTGGQVLRLAERFADALQVGFLGFLRLDAKPNDSAAFRVYANSAT